MLTDTQWAALAPLIEVCRPHAKVPSRHLRRTIEAILWRHDKLCHVRRLCRVVPGIVAGRHAPTLVLGLPLPA
jgi:transposase